MIGVWSKYTYVFVLCVQGEVDGCKVVVEERSGWGTCRWRKWNLTCHRNLSDPISHILCVLLEMERNRLEFRIRERGRRGGNGEDSELVSVPHILSVRWVGGWKCWIAAASNLENFRFLCKDLGDFAIRTSMHQKGKRLPFPFISVSLSRAGSNWVLRLFHANHNLPLGQSSLHSTTLWLGWAASRGIHRLKNGRLFHLLRR